LKPYSKFILTKQPREPQNSEEEENMATKKIILSEEDRKELTELYHEAQTTPVIGFSVQQMITGKDWAQ
jgi:peptidyl-tRNA hydrolase